MVVSGKVKRRVKDLMKHAINTCKQRVICEYLSTFQLEIQFESNEFEYVYVNNFVRNVVNQRRKF